MADMPETCDDLARNLAEQLQCKAALAQGPEQGLLRWRDDLVAEEVLIRAEDIA